MLVLLFDLSRMKFLWSLFEIKTLARRASLLSLALWSCFLARTAAIFAPAINPYKLQNDKKQNKTQ